MHVYSLTNFKKIKKIKGTGEPVLTLSSIRIGQNSYLISTSFDQTIILYNIYKQKPKLLLRMLGVGSEITQFLDLSNGHHTLGVTVDG